MKRFTKYMVIALATVAAVACAKDDEAVTPAVMQKITFTAEAPVANDASRAGYNSTVGAHWDANDDINVWLNKNTPSVTFSQVAGTMSNDKRSVTYQGEYTGTDAISSTIGAVYLPAESFNGGGACRITLPAAQTYVEGGYTQIPLLAKGEAVTNGNGTVTIETLNFKNYFSILKFNLTSQSGAAINSITLKDPNDVQIAGRVLAYPRATESNTANEGVIRSWNGSPVDYTITLNCEEAVELSETPTAFHIVVPSFKLHTFENGINVTINSTVGVITKTIKKLEALAQNTIYDTPTLAINKPSVQIPDAAFRGWLLENSLIEDDSTNDDASYVYITKEGADATKIEIKEKVGDGITSLQGVENFVNLKNLYCEKNSLTSIDVSKLTKLEQLRVDENQLTELDITNNTKLVYLYCQNNKLTTLDVSSCPNTLKYIRCYNNHLSVLDISMLTAGQGIQYQVGGQTNIETGESQTLTLKIGTLVEGTDIVDKGNNTNVVIDK